MSQSLPLGTTLLNGKYHIRKVLGRGSFGITYLAETKSVLHGSLGTLEFGVTVAIKEFFLRDINQRDTITAKVEGSTGELFASYQRKFRKEALNLTKLTHSGIIKVLDVFDENGTTYYAMEFVEGQTLDDYILEHGALPEEEAIDILVEIGNALQYMHSQKMLHLDIKPKNIMRSLDGKHRLIDFGLSKTFGGDGESESSSNIGLGTPGYASLEQATYKQDGSFPATLDIYSLGATFFKMLTGHRPPEPTEILNHGFPEDDLKECGVCGRTISIISKAMALAKVARYQSVQEFISDLTSPLPESETTSSPLDVITPEEITIISPQSENPKPETQTESRSDENEENPETSAPQVDPYIDSYLNNQEEDLSIEEVEDFQERPSKKNIKLGILIGLLGILFLIGSIFIFKEFGKLNYAKENKEEEKEIVSVFHDQHINFDLDEVNQNATVVDVDNGLTLIDIPSRVENEGTSYSVTGISSDALGGRTDLKAVTLPNTIKSIGDAAFSGCVNLRSVNIPTSVTKIGWSAFKGCEKLNTINCYASQPPKIQVKCFDYRKNQVLHVPRGTKQIYSTTPYWRKFTKIVDDL